MRIHDGRKKLDKRSLVRQIKSGTISMDLSFDEETSLGQSIVRRLLEFYRLCMHEASEGKYLELGGSIRFHVSQIRAFDLSFLATLGLLRHRLPKVDISLHFRGPRTFAKAPKIFFQFGHFMATAMTSGATPFFRLKYNHSWVKPEPDNLNHFLVSSTEYLPLLKINQNEYETYFQTPFRSLWDDVLWQRLAVSELETIYSSDISASKIFRERLYQAFRAYIVSLAARGLRDNRILKFDRHSCVLSFLHAMRQLACINMLLREHVGEIQDKRLKDNIEGVYGLGIFGFRSRDNKSYQNQMKRRLQILFDRPSYFVMIFCVLIENTFSFSPKEKYEVAKVLERIDSTLSFAAQLFDGLKELVKNVLEHATEKWGILSLRLFNAKTLSHIKLPEFGTYLDERPDTQEFVDFVLLDDSEAGIVAQTVNKLSAMKDEFQDSLEQNIIEGDISRIQSSEVTLRDFFVIKRTPLLHQEIRSAASLGLLIFSDFLIKNDGITYVSTIDGNTVKAALVFKEHRENIHEQTGMSFGTYYNVMLPIPAAFDKPLRSAPTYYIPYESEAAMDAYEELNKIRLIDCGDINEDARLRCSHDSRCIKKMDVPKQFIANLSQKPTLLRPDACKSCATRHQMILAIRLLDDPIETDPSAIFRLLARVQRDEACRSVIVYNIKERSLQRLLTVLRIYEKVTGRAWSKDQFVLFYYLPEPEQLGKPCYYTWVIGGERFADTVALNSRILFTNQGRMLAYSHQDIEVPDPELMKRYHLNPLFSGSGHLLPFDVLLKEGEHSLFEWNVLFALNTPILEETHARL